MRFSLPGISARSTAFAVCWALALLLCAALIAPPQTHDLVGPNGQIVIGLPDGVADDNLDQLNMADGPTSAIVVTDIWLHRLTGASSGISIAALLVPYHVHHPGSARGPPKLQA